MFTYSINKNSDRICGDVICKCDGFEEIVGYINTSYKLNDSADSYINIIKGDNALLDNAGIGFRKNNLVTINITGPLLVKNPFILEKLLIGLDANKNSETISQNQYTSYKITLDKLKKRFN